MNPAELICPSVSSPQRQQFAEQGYCVVDDLFSPEEIAEILIAHYISETSEQVARFYHPGLDAKGEVVSRLHVPEGGGPCGDGWEGAAH